MVSFFKSNKEFDYFEPNNLIPEYDPKLERVIYKKIESTPSNEVSSLFTQLKILFLILGLGVLAFKYIYGDEPAETTEKLLEKLTTLIKDHSLNKENEMRKFFNSSTSNEEHRYFKLIFTLAWLNVSDKNKLKAIFSQSTDKKLRDKIIHCCGHAMKIVNSLDTSLRDSYYDEAKEFANTIKNGHLNLAELCEHSLEKRI